MEETKVLQLKITLADTKPTIWRRILLKDNCSFYELHMIIQCAMGWENYHLYEFNINNYRIGEPDSDFDYDNKVIHSKEVKLNAILLESEKESFHYTYDFGDTWNHEITVEKILPSDKIQNHPVCTEGAMNCPPEDCGGIPGFTHFVNVMKDPENSQYEELMEWYGQAYDPEYLSLQDINHALKSLDKYIELEETGLFDDDESFEDSTERFFNEELDFMNLLPDLHVKVVNHSKHPLPEYKTEGSAGMDLQANISEDITLKSLERVLVKTGLHIELPLGAEAQVRPRSGLALKHGITVLNSPGTIDADYRGEIGVILVNLSSDTFVIKDGERIAQLVVAQHERVDWDEVDELGDTDRGEGGFGSTGK